MQAKLQAKEQETLQLQKQVQDLQAQLLSFQINGAGPLYKQQLEQIQSRCQALQAENNEIRTLAMLYMDENARLHAVSTHSSLHMLPMPIMAEIEVPKPQACWIDRQIVGDRSSTAMHPKPQLAACVKYSQRLRRKVIESIKMICTFPLLCSSLLVTFLHSSFCILQDRKHQLLPLANQMLCSSSREAGLQHLLMQKQLQQATPLSLPFGHQIEPAWLEAMKAAEPSVSLFFMLPLV